MNRLCLAAAFTLAVATPAAAALLNLNPVQGIGGGMSAPPYQEPQTQAEEAEPSQVSSTQDSTPPPPTPTDSFEKGEKQTSNNSEPPGLNGSEDERLRRSEEASLQSQKQSPRPGQITGMRNPRGDGTPPQVDPRGVRRRAP